MSCHEKHISKFPWNHSDKKSGVLRKDSAQNEVDASRNAFRKSFVEHPVA